MAETETLADALSGTSETHVDAEGVILKAIQHRNEEQTVVGAIPVGGGFYALFAMDVDTGFNPIKSESIGRARGKQAAITGVEWWCEQNPKGLEYSILESIKMMFGGLFG